MSAAIEPAAALGSTDPALNRTARDLLRVIDGLVAIRPVNWEDSRDPQQRAAWRAADAVLVRFGVR